MPSDQPTADCSSGVRKTSESDIRCKRVDAFESGVQMLGEYILHWERCSTSTHAALTEKKRFHCAFPGCPRSYVHKRNLRSHENADHIRRNLYKCQRCSYRSYRKVYVMRHFKCKHAAVVAEQLTGMIGANGRSNTSHAMEDRQIVEVRFVQKPISMDWRSLIGT